MAYGAYPPPPELVTSGAKSIRGLDLLGLRAPVQYIGNLLLTGVTTVSPIVRYLGLRAWILRRYAEARLPDSYDSLQDFAGRVEAAIVLGNLAVDPSTTGLVGSTDATKLLDENTSTVNLKAFVQQVATSIYTGPSEQLLISYEPDGEVPGLTEERGLPLHLAVEATLSSTRFAAMLQENPEIDLVELDVLKQLGKAFPIGEPPERERSALLAAILPAAPQDQELARLRTYAVLLELADFLGADFSDQSLFDEAVRMERRVDDVHQSSLDGWLVYLGRDMLAVAHERAFRAIVDLISQPEFVEGPVDGAVLLSRLLDDASDHSAALHALDLWDSADSPLTIPLRQVQERIRGLTGPRTDGPLPRWNGLTEVSVIETASRASQGSIALLPVAWLLVNERFGDLEHVEPFDRLLDYNGYERFGVFEVVRPTVEDFLRRDLSLGEAALELGFRTVEQHLRMAWARLGADPRRDVSVIAADGDAWVLVEGRDFGSGRTASRLKQAIGWLRQLDLVSTEGLTDEGRRVLSQLCETLVAKQT